MAVVVPARVRRFRFSMLSQSGASEMGDGIILERDRQGCQTRITVCVRASDADRGRGDGRA